MSVDTKKEKESWIKRMENDLKGRECIHPSKSVETVKNAIFDLKEKRFEQFVIMCDAKGNTVQRFCENDDFKTYNLLLEKYMSDLQKLQIIELKILRQIIFSGGCSLLDSDSQTQIKHFKQYPLTKFQIELLKSTIADYDPTAPERFDLEIIYGIRYLKFLGIPVELKRKHIN
jgi:hypothetical protein